MDNHIMTVQLAWHGYARLDCTHRLYGRYSLLFIDNAWTYDYHERAMAQATCEKGPLG